MSNFNAEFRMSDFATIFNLAKKASFWFVGYFEPVKALFDRML